MGWPLWSKVYSTDLESHIAHAPMPLDALRFQWQPPKLGADEEEWCFQIELRESPGKAVDTEEGNFSVPA